MPLASGELNYAGAGEVYVAPEGTAMPVSETVALNAAFVGLGYTTEDGVTMTASVTMQETPAWQSAYPIDRRVDKRDWVTSFTLLQINKVTWALNFGGGSWATATGTHTYTPPADSFIDYRAMVIHLVDGADITRILMPKGLITDSGDFQTRRAEASGFALSFGLVTTGSGNPYTVLSNRSEFATP